MMSVSDNNNRPLITHGGDTPVFNAVLPFLQKEIGVEAVEWKRAYGRSIKHVHLNPQFVPFDAPDPLLGGGGGGVDNNVILTSLLDQPMLHTFWTDCSDVEVYRTTTKDVIQSWLNSVKSCPIKEWLIILVEPPDNKKTNKLLPRTSVLDKIKSDFAQKQTERCICVSDPQKIDSKTTDSLKSMLHRIRQLLLASYSKTLTKFEENMRAQREKRNDAGWNFCHYFLLQEELAFVLEMLEVYDEALVQYDELDALFTQFVLNSHFTDTPKWMLSFQRYGDRWPSLTLTSISGAPQVLQKIRESIKSSSVSLLNFRNYLFARQAKLLVKQGRMQELAQRSLAFLHVCINELSILEIAFTEDGAICCWVFVSCLEILQTISSQQSVNNNGVSEDGQPQNMVDGNSEPDGILKHKGKHHHLPHASTLDFSVHTASLWDYAREKLYELGKICGLLPKCHLKSDHLHKVISLAAGLTPFEEIANSNGNGTNAHHEEELTLPLPVLADGQTPIEKLKDALSSKEKFQHNYLELCELAMGTYKHIGRLRSARKVGLSLASFYMEAEELTKAVVFLTDAYNTFREDKWPLLTIDVLLKLAHCYQTLNDTERYIRICAQIACSKHIDENRRSSYFDEMMNSLTKLENNDRLIMSHTEETFLISSANIETSGKIHGEFCDVIVHLELLSNFPRPIVSNLIQMAIIQCDHVPKEISLVTGGKQLVKTPINIDSKRGSGSGDSLRRKDSLESNSSEKNVDEVERGLKVGVKQRLTRKESVTPALTCEDEDIALALMEVNPAVNMMDLRVQYDSAPGGNAGNNRASSDGSIPKDKVTMGRLMCHNPHQSLRRKDSSQVQGEKQISKTDFSEAAKSTDIVITPGANKIILNAQISQAGSYRLAQLSIGVKHFELLSPRLGCRYRINVSKEVPDIQVQAGNLVAGIQQKVLLVINTGSYCINKNMMLLMRSSLGLRMKEESSSEFCTELSLSLPEATSFSTASVELIVNADLLSREDGTVVKHKIITKCPWTNQEKRLSLTFISPFVSSYKLHTVAERKFLQVILAGNSDNFFKLSEHQLTVQSPNAQDIPLVGLNPRSQALVLDSGKNAAYMWEIGVQNVDEDQVLRFEFSVNFATASGDSEVYKYYICLRKFKTLYELSAKVDPHKGTEFCRAGNMCSMVIVISSFPNKKKDRNANDSLMYEVRADQHMWAICGRSSGVLTFEGSDATTQQISLEMMPMNAGYLPLPTVHLSKYIPAEQKGGGASKLEPFNIGQVYNSSKGAQIHVLPPPQSGGSCVASGLSGGSSISSGSSLTITSEHL